MKNLNDHFTTLKQYDYLFVDELGPLELERGEGLTNAVELLKSGESKKAFVVVRPHLVCKAKDIFMHSKIEVFEINNLPKYDALL